MLHNNYGLDPWPFEGAAAALEMIRAGIAYADPRGLTSLSSLMDASSLSLLFDIGGHDEALDLAAALAAQFEAAGNMGDLTEVRAIQSRIPTLRGQPDRVAGWLDWLVTTARDASDTQVVVLCLAVAAATHAVLRRREPAAVEPRHPYTEHALVTADAALTEHRGDHHTAATNYADAAARWEQFGVIPEQAHALLGQAPALSS
ncbi:MAG: hypothetical protein WAN48_03680 [Actinomycetes bacterium]